MRIVSCVTALLLLVTLCACSGNSDRDSTVITKSQTKSPTQTTTTTTTTTATQKPTEEQNDPSSGSTSTAPTTLPSIIGESGTSETGNAIAQLALSLVGTAFKNGGSGPDVFDNPGFVTYCYKQNGYTVPRKATSIINYGLDVNPEEIQPGDILVFCNEIGEDAGFVGIYIGSNQFVAATNPSTATKIHKLNDKYWSQRFLSARRFQ